MKVNMILVEEWPTHNGWKRIEKISYNYFNSKKMIPVIFVVVQFYPWFNFIAFCFGVW